MTDCSIEWIEDGSLTTPRGFLAGAAYTGIKTYGDEPRLDLGILHSERPCAAAGIFTRSAVCGAPVSLSRRHLSDASAQGLIVNSGCSNVAMGARGERDALRMAELAAAKLGLSAQDVLVGSTGVIGRALPMERIEAGLAQIELDRDSGRAFARAMMTTDTVEKSRALCIRVGDRAYLCGGAAKGSGMVHPDMATVFCFLTTDAPVDPAWLATTLKQVGDVSINMVDVDMDTSTSDSMLLFANGAAGGEPINGAHPHASALRQGLQQLAIELARDLARDGEGARTLIEVEVAGAASDADARLAARTVVSSPLVKTMITGRDPNMGRVMMALGRSGAALQVERIGVWIGSHCAFRQGAATEADLAVISRAMDTDEVKLRVELGMGSGRAVAWGCDLTEGYVRINADYTT